MAESAIVWRLGLDKSQIQSGLRDAESEVASSGGRVGGSFERSSAGGERLFTSSHRAATQVRILSTELARGASASDLFSAGIESLERVLRLPLGALAGLAVGGIIIQQLGKIREETAKTREQTNLALFPTLPAESAGIESLIARVKVLNELLAQNIKQQQNIQAGGWAEVGQSFKDAASGIAEIFSPRRLLKDIASYGPTLGLSLYADVLRGAVVGARSRPEERRQDIVAETAEKSRDYEAEAHKIRESGVDVEKKLAALAVERAQFELSTANTLEAKRQRQFDLEKAQLALEKASAEDKAKGGAAGIEERSKVSLADIAKYGRTQTGYSEDMAPGRAAQEIQRLEELARRTASRGTSRDLEQAVRLISRADELRSGLTTLKDSERTTAAAIKGGLDSSTRLERIEENTRKQDRSY